MLELDGRKYQILTPSENTSSLVSRINEYCVQNNVKNSKGEVIYIEENFASPIYLILWAVGYLTAFIQNLIYNVAKSFNVQAASDEQLLNIADMAAVKRGEASKTTFNLVVRAMAESDEMYDPDANEGKLVITSEDSITYQDVVYKPALYPSITIEPNEFGYITMVAEDVTSNQIAAGTIQQFDSSIPNLASISQPEDAIPGQTQETIASLRERIQRKQYSGTMIDSAIDEIRALPGITVCNIYYNELNTQDKFVGRDSLKVSPRHALIIVQGYSEKIAEAYLKYLTAPTFDYEYTRDPSSNEITGYNDLSNYPEERVLQIQKYVTKAQQEIPVMILKPLQEQVMITVFLGMPIDSSIEYNMKQTVVEKLMASTVVGQDVNSAMVLASLSDYSSYNILGALVNTPGNAQGYRTYIADDVILTYNINNITISMPGAD